MKAKPPIYPLRVRQVPRQFSWVDHRLVRDRHIESCSHPAAALYLFLVTVTDNQGMSYYSDPALMTRLAMDVAALDSARQNLIRVGLIAYESPLYQVLSLEPFVQTGHAPRVVQSMGPMDQPVPIAQIFKRIMGESS
jgi:hypothetical protein